MRIWAPNIKMANGEEYSRILDKFKTTKIQNNNYGIIATRVNILFIYIYIYKKQLRH